MWHLKINDSDIANCTPLNGIIIKIKNIPKPATYPNPNYLRNKQRRFL